MQFMPESIYRCEKGSSAMKEKLIFATSNEGKMKEIREILSGLNLEIQSMKEAGLDLDIVEDGDSFEANARIKALAVYEAEKKRGRYPLVLADDSGLEIDYLNGEPGVYSARYLGEDTPYEIKNQIVIERMKGTKGEERSARFVSVIAAVFPDGTVKTTTGTVEGLIAEKPAGTGGFGYDPIFYLPEFGVTSAQLTLEEKNKISHRGKALAAMKEEIKRYLGEKE